MKAISVEDTTVTAEELATMATKEPGILTRKGQPPVAVRAVSGSDWESVSQANNPRFVAIIEDSRRAYREKGGIPVGRFRKELGLKPRKAAATKRRGRQTAG